MIEWLIMTQNYNDPNGMLFILLDGPHDYISMIVSDNVYLIDINSVSHQMDTNNLAELKEFLKNKESVNIIEIDSDGTILSQLRVNVNHEG